MPRILRCLLVSFAIGMPASTVTASSPAPVEVVDLAEDDLAPLFVVRVDMEDGDTVAGESAAGVLHQELVVTLREAAVAPELPEGAPLELLVSADSEVLGAYAVEYRHRGEVLDSWSCPCSGQELLARLRPATIGAWHLAMAAAAPEVMAPVPAPNVKAVTTEPSGRRHQHGLGPWVAGVTITAMGTSLVVGMTALLVTDAADERRVDPLTLGIWSGGMAMVATGATLWGIGARRRRGATMSLRPAGMRRGVLVSVEGRF